jgi:hypothetical protein
MTLTSSSDYTLGSSTTARTDIINDDLSLYLNNGSDNIILDGSSDPGTLTFNYPTEEKDGATLTLVDNDPSDANVYLTADPGPDDTPILGDVDGTLVSTYTVVEGSGTMPRMAYVIPTKGSDSIGQVSFSGTDDDSETDNTDDSNGITPITVAIVPVTDPNGSGLSNWSSSSTPLPWLVGQMVNVDAEVDGPSGLVKDLPVTYQWTIPSGDNVLELYNSETGSSTTLGVTNDDGGAASHIEGSGDTPVRTGLKQKRLEFFWVSAPATNPDTISVKITGVGAGSGLIDDSASTKFHVYTPTVISPSAKQGVVEFNIWKPYVGLYYGNGYPSGMNFDATVEVPTIASLSQGSWQYVQTVTDYTHETRVDANGHNPVGEHLPYPGGFGLDNTYPYDGPWDTGPDHHATADNPGNPLLSPGASNDILLNTSKNASWSMFIMFKPAGGQSQWVPLEVDQWAIRFGAMRTGGSTTGAWIFDPSFGDPNSAANKSNSGFLPTASEPLWDLVFVNGHNWQPD